MDNRYCHREALGNSTPEPNIPHRRPARGLGERLDPPEAPLEISSPPLASCPFPTGENEVKTRKSPREAVWFVCSSWNITRLNPSAKELVPFQGKQRSTVKTNPLSSQHQALGLYFPYFLGSQCSVLPLKQPLHNLLLQSRCHRCSPEVP